MYIIYICIMVDVPFGEVFTHLDHWGICLVLQQNDETPGVSTGALMIYLLVEEAELEILW